MRTRNERQQAAAQAMNQFSAEDERIGHARMLNNIARARLADEPEPSHDEWVDETNLFTWGSREPVDTIREWCCEWHRYHADD